MLRNLLAVLLLALIGINLYAAEAQLSGAVHEAHYNQEKLQLTISGQAWDKNQQEGADEFRIEANGVKPRRIEKQISSDNPGNFEVIADLEIPLKKGLSRIAITAVFPSGAELELQNVDGSPLFIHQAAIYTRHWILLAIIVLFVLATTTQSFRQKMDKADTWMDKNKKKVFAGIIAIFFLLVSAGITGSSLRILFGGPFGSAAAEVSGSDARLFKLRPDRGDEWGVLTPNVLAQIHHSPKFPIINTNIGLEGQNMGVIGMTGVPIKQWAALARPATWGYFFLPLRQAQAWQWQLPFWGCLLALWWLLSHWKPRQSGRNLALSFLFCIAPYAAAWSNWPLYATFFPAMALGISIALSKSRGTFKGIALGIALGYCIAGWVLTLYPPWIISIGTLAFILYIGWLFDNKESVHPNKAQFIGLASAMIIAGLLLGSWWQDTQHAIALMQATVYPGQRTTITGGDNSFLWIFRGYTNLEAVTFGTGPWTNQPEISSYLWFPLVIAWLCIWGMIREREHRWTIAGISIFVGFYALFVFIGIPPWLAEISQWGRVPTNRGDVSLGLAIVFLMALLSKNWVADRTIPRTRNIHNLTAALVLSGSLLAVYFHLLNMPIYVFPKNSPIYIASILTLTLFCAWWSLKGETAKLIGLMLIAYLVSTLGFNPVSKAPRDIKISARTKELASNESGEPLRTLVIGGDGIGPLSLAAVGIPIVNGVLYYPHRTLWTQLELNENYWNTVNRYQHLGFTTGKNNEPEAYTVSAPLMDQVSVKIDPMRFDFSRTGAHRVAALEEQAIHLRGSPMLEELGSHKGLVWFAIKTGNNPAPSEGQGDHSSPRKIDTNSSA